MTCSFACYSITFECLDEGQKRPSRETLFPYIDLFMPDDVSLYPGEKATINLGVVMDFPRGTCGLVMLKNTTARKLILRMNPLVVGKDT